MNWQSSDSSDEDEFTLGGEPEEYAADSAPENLAPSVEAAKLRTDFSAQFSGALGDSPERDQSQASSRGDLEISDESGTAGTDSGIPPYVRRPDIAEPIEWLQKAA